MSKKKWPKKRAPFFLLSSSSTPIGLLLLRPLKCRQSPHQTNSIQNNWSTQFLSLRLKCCSTAKKKWMSKKKQNTPKIIKRQKGAYSITLKNRYRFLIIEVIKKIHCLWSLNQNKNIFFSFYLLSGCIYIALEGKIAINTWHWKMSWLRSNRTNDTDCVSSYGRLF